ncbi:ribulokinase [Paenibacillus contaminans]|uniref:Ribulokinase n=1 Tax=Paenibacillus contaminans TaxID=450362 RepID=A0A329MJE9_9BACL|nr:ribulokinase [Paenibacillus contaminans]RAV19688.1 ribulokinase [Paenibacillus contaminans]
MEKRYVIGIDFGTESGRVVLVDADNGDEIADHETRYAHGVMMERLPGSGKRLEPDWTIQHPGDYLEVLRHSVPQVLRASGVGPGQVVGIGVDFTSCTMLPVDERGTPLCMQDAYRDEPHAYVKLWKHHAAEEESARIDELAAARGETFLGRYGGKGSSEWMLAKIWQTLNEAPHIYETAHRFMEAGDWIVYRLTGNPVRSGCSAGYKAFWHKTDGYPSPSFLKTLDPRLERLAETKLSGEVRPIGTKAGGLTEEAAALTGLLPGTAVAVAVIDAHAGVPGSGAVKPGQMVMAMGTSLCHMMLSDKEAAVEGVRGVVEDGIIPGLYGYEAGQPAVGDLFGWFVGHAVPAYVQESSDGEGISVHVWLEREAARQKPGGHGLLALDWWNGNRSVLAETDLSGLVVGMTLQTKPEDIYRALLEATAFGTRKIIEAFEASGVAMHELFACGGLPRRNRLLMQIFADVTGREIKVAASSQTTALGAAMFGAVAAGSERGGCADIAEAAVRMAKVREETFRPNPEHKAVYDELYREYCRLHDLFGRGGFRVMQELKRIKLEQNG